jgi:hypothetical protein
MQGCMASKIDAQATIGLLGASNSLAYRIHELERHFHGRERWFGKLAVQTATDWADNNIATPYIAISGNNAYGTDANDEALVVGTADTPAMTNLATGLPNVKYDLHQLLLVGATSVSVYKLQLIYGSGAMADAIAAGQYSTMMCRVDEATTHWPMVAHDVMMPRVTCGVDKVWVRAWNATNNATISFFAGWHEYEG